MKVAFFHDVKLLEDKNKKMYSVDFGYEVWKRYLETFDDIIVCTRIENKKDQNLKAYKVSSGENVKFECNREYKSPLQFFTQKSKIKKPIKKVVNESDACIIRLPSVIGILAANECIKQKKPWAVEVVGCCWDSLWNYGSIKGKLLAPFMYGYNKFYISKAKYAIYVSKEFLQRRYPCNGIVSNASDVNIEKIEENVICKRINKIKEKKSKDVVTLGLIGSLDVEYKGHGTAIKAIKELNKKGYNIKLKCLGSGDTEKWMRLCKDLGVEDMIEFCGTLPSGKPVLEWIDNIDIFIMPSLTEGLPRSMVEAMSRGCNILGSRVGGIPELIENEFTFCPKDYNQLTMLIIRLIEDKKLAINQSIANFTKSKEYVKSSIDKERNLFFDKFRNEI